ncbi:MAG: TRAP transporter substrate-binding protein [Desulfobacteraceae bacterium]|nr:MAG: TRAP transporter substrate-binding protein [Desulfobacteraceae bacterium]
MKKSFLCFLAVGVLLIGAAEGWPQAKDIRWGTAPVGSVGYRALVPLTALLSKEMTNYRFAALPMPGAIVSVKGYATGQIEAYYGADIAFYEMANSINRFKGFKEQMKRMPVQSFWTYTTEVGVGIPAKSRDKLKQWRDLSGKNVFTGPLPWDVRAQLERAFQELGIKHEYVEVDLATVGSLLEQGRLDGFITYTNAESGTAPWITEVSLSTDFAILNPSREEIEILKKKGFGITEVDPKVFKKDVHVDKVIHLPFYYGFHVGIEIPQADVYKMLNIIEKNAAELAKSDTGFEQVRKDMAGMQRRGVEAAIEFVEVHPGLAQWMREKGVWNPKWDNRIAKQ